MSFSIMNAVTKREATPVSPVRM
jgi:hypothetical protein